MSVFTEQFELGQNADLTGAIKDNIDVVGFVTQAGSEGLCQNPILSFKASTVTFDAMKIVTIISMTSLHKNMSLPDDS